MTRTLFLPLLLLAALVLPMGCDTPQEQPVTVAWNV